jgi:hypothetical protein
MKGKGTNIADDDVQAAGIGVCCAGVVVCMWASAMALGAVCASGAVSVAGPGMEACTSGVPMGGPEAIASAGIAASLVGGVACMLDASTCVVVSACAAVDVSIAPPAITALVSTCSAVLLAGTGPWISGESIATSPPAFGVSNDVSLVVVVSGASTSVMAWATGMSKDWTALCGCAGMSVCAAIAAGVCMC